MPCSVLHLNSFLLEHCATAAQRSMIKKICSYSAVNHGPCCPIHQSTLDSPDYWTDPALMSSAAPASSTEWRRWELESRNRHAKWATRHGQWQTTPGHCFHGLIKPSPFSSYGFQGKYFCNFTWLLIIDALKGPAVTRFCSLGVLFNQGFIVLSRECCIGWAFSHSWCIRSSCGLSALLSIFWGLLRWAWTLLVEMLRSFRLMT